MDPRFMKVTMIVNNNRPWSLLEAAQLQKSLKIIVDSKATFPRYLLLEGKIPREAIVATLNETEFDYSVHEGLENPELKFIPRFA